MVGILVLVLLAGAALAQPPAESGGNITAVVMSAPAKPSVGSAAAVAPDETVLTIRGLCSPAGNPPQASACALQVTRQQFDDLMKIVAPGAETTTAGKQRFAATYANLLAYESAARKSGLENTSQVRQTIEWLRLRTLAELYRRNLEKELSAVSQQESDEYYHTHIQQFEEAKLRRILLPRNNLSAEGQEAFEKRSLQMAIEIRGRAARGEDFEQLQKEAYIGLGFNGLPPSTQAGDRRRSSLASQVAEDVFALRPGEISPVEKELYSFIIYKVESKRALPEPQVHEEIAREITKQKLEMALRSITSEVHTDMNANYFGAPQEP